MYSILRNGYKNLKMKNKNIILMKKCNNWEIPINKNNNNINKSPFLFDSKWCAETLNIENKGKIIKKKNW